MPDNDEYDLGRPLGYRHVRKRMSRYHTDHYDVCATHIESPLHKRSIHCDSTEKRGWLAQPDLAYEGEKLDFNPPTAGLPNSTSVNTELGPVLPILAEEIISSINTVPNLEIDGIY